MRHRLTIVDPLRLFVFVSLALVVTFCGGQATDSGSSESHFLSPCDATCEGGFSCLCGVCTRLCDGADGCGTLSGATCTTTSCDTPTENVCDVTCTTAGDCGALGSGYDCVEGRCRRQSGSAQDAGPLTCEERTQLASQRIQEAIVAADQSCTTDSDCLMVSNSADCFESCGAILSTEGAAMLASAIDELNSGVCAGFEADGCPLIVPPCVPTGTPVCLAGSCTDSFSTGAHLTCEEWTAEARRRVEDAIRAADQSCATDADCTRILTVSLCHFPCGATFVSTESAETVQATIDSIDSGFCAGFADQCPQPAPSCPPPADAVCTPGGLCTAGQSCTARADEAFQRIQDAVQSADRNCTTASDCVAISNTSNCQYGCGVVLSVVGAAALQATIDELNNTICAAYDSTCPPPIPPPCPFPGNTTCIDGQCVMVL